MTAYAAPPLYTLPIASRPQKTWAQTLNAILFGTIFDLACITINAAQFALLVLKFLLPFIWSRELYDEGIRWTKGCFGALLLLVTQWFAPTNLVLTFEREGKGRLTEQEIDDVLVRDATSAVIGLRLPPRAVLISNHQVYADWMYAWCLLYYMGTHKDVFIVLKKSLKWVPIIGWGMQFYRFLFLARSWAADKTYLVSQLASLGREAEHNDRPFSFILYPEGTLVSEETRPVSKKYADKIGIPDLLHALLPRSTGLLYTLRSLSPRVPALHLIDVTVAYPGVPPGGYGQSYYTLRSIFFDRVPPPTIHMHIRVFNVAQDVPIGNVEIDKDQPHTGDSVEVDVPPEEASRFDLWLRGLWQDKDGQLTRYYANGGTFATKGNPSVVIPLRLRHGLKTTISFCIILPIILGYFMALFRR